MNGGGGDFTPPPPTNGGEYLLSLIQNPHNPPPQFHQPPSQPPPQQFPTTTDPAVAFMGPTIHVSSPWKINGPDHPQQFHHHHHYLPYQSNLFGLSHNPFPPIRDDYSSTQISVANDLRKLGFFIEGNNNNNINMVEALLQHQELKLKFGSLPIDSFAPDPQFQYDVGSLLNLKFNYNGYGRNLHLENPKPNPNLSSNGNVIEHDRIGVMFGRVNSDFHGVGNFRSEPSRSNDQWGSGTRRKGSEVSSDELVVRNESVHAMEEVARRGSNVGCEMRLPEHLDHPGPPSGSNLHLVSASDIEEPRSMFQSNVVGDGVRDKFKGDGRLKMEDVADYGRGSSGGSDEVDVLGEQLGDSLLLEDVPEENNNSKQQRRDKDARQSDLRGQWLLSQRARMYKRQMICRRDIDSLNVPFLLMYQSLIPPDEEKVKQKQLLSLLERLVIKEWPKARLYLYGSCANSFGISKSDIDVCLAIEEAHMDKSKLIMKLADILQSDNLQNVQALIHARVPIVKLMDPMTGISCDICINNLLAVVNTKLLWDYSRIDARLRQLAFIIKHWAKSRRVNETYHGTLSSYAYVLMCINFLQQRRPAILPCLQEMKTTYSVTVDDIDCSFFDQVEKLYDFGHRNKETIAQLVWGFFYYWAYCHDYTNDVISVRTGSIISKREKNWTRRIGNDRHLICIEDPFEMSHDLGRVVDKHSIKVLREEFERAADIMQFDPNPCVKLFEPYVPS
ncbi:hypothetical protein TanjilG_31050 [Lupinus angustifolius]|uniref:RNA uridylyltransferase n=1 Tax=Lupinus angustifolius TaxID=3871 RepID=A0A1J7IWV1_LUPAN|nr:PREDICTED: UTP:RNA uridylyltransferase 1-like isoform X1 [Lupinus angustifolius]OIW18992.1 hypothetical protein TanjilG_31050 [Lupinus angustifolius]